MVYCCKPYINVNLLMDDVSYCCKGYINGNMLPNHMSYFLRNVRKYKNLSASFCFLYMTF